MFINKFRKEVIYLKENGIVTAPDDIIDVGGPTSPIETQPKIVKTEQSEARDIFIANMNA